MLQNAIDHFEDQVRQRFQAGADREIARTGYASKMVYREMPTVGSDRDIRTFVLEWVSPNGQLECVAVHVDHLHGRVVCQPGLQQLEIGRISLAWLDSLLSQARTVAA